MYKAQFVSDVQTDYILEEKLYKISKDTNYIYNKAFKSFVDDFDKGNLKDLKEYSINDSNMPLINKYRIKGFVFSIINTSDLKTEESVHADLLLNVPIFCGVFDEGSFHEFNKKGNPFIQISLDYRAVMDALKHGKDFYKGYRDKAFQRQIKNVFGEHRVKALISHELSHWIDNANYDVFAKIIGNAKTDEERADALLLKKENVNMTYFEIQGQIHGIAKLKEFYDLGDIWDTLSLEELLEHDVSLSSIAIDIDKKHGKDVLNIWLRFLVKRMSREGLLGKNMRLPFDMKKLYEEESKKTYRI